MSRSRIAPFPVKLGRHDVIRPCQMAGVLAAVGAHREMIRACSQHVAKARRRRG